LCTTPATSFLSPFSVKPPVANSGIGAAAIAAICTAPNPPTIPAKTILAGVNGNWPNAAVTATAVFIPACAIAASLLARNACFLVSLIFSLRANSSCNAFCFWSAKAFSAARCLAIFFYQTFSIF